MEPARQTPSGINLFYPLFVTLLGVTTYGAYFFFAPQEVAPTEETAIPTLITDTPPLSALTSSTSLQDIAAASSSANLAVQLLNVQDQDAVPVAASSQTQKNTDRLSPSTPTGLTARLIGDDKVVLSWSPSTDNAGIAGYRVYRNSVAIGTTIKTIYSFIRLTPSTTYTFGVVAYDSAGNVSKTQNILITTAKKPEPQSATTATPPQAAVVETPVPQTPAPEAVAYCGNGTQDRGEECDDGNTSDNDSCTNQCKAAYCGDTIINYQSEQCDDGNQYDNDYCTNQCQNHTPVVADTPAAGTPTTTSSSDTTSTSPTTYTIRVTSDGVYDSTSLTLQKGDIVKFVYSSPIEDEVVIRFSPTTISSITLDHEHTERSRTFNTAGTWTFRTDGNQGSLVVQ